MGRVVREFRELREFGVVANCLKLPKLLNSFPFPLIFLSLQFFLLHSRRKVLNTLCVKQRTKIYKPKLKNHEKTKLFVGTPS